VPVVRNPVTDSEPVLSPDGRWLAYVSDETGEYDAFVQPFPTTGAKWQVSTGGGRQPMWRRDGRELYFTTNDARLFAVDVPPGATFEPGTPRLLFKMPSDTISVRNSYIPSRDGQRFLVNMTIEAAVPAINVDLDWAATRRRGARPE
jgi:dipeptidyl aminopeptidase/acylaminoacyl peptidase